MLNLPSRTKWAFRCSFESLVQFARENGQELTWWRFSLRENIPHWCSYAAFNGLFRDLRHHYEEDDPLYGIRVCEAQDGKRIHWHAVLNKRIPIELVDRLGERHGMGFSFAKKVTNPQGTIDYMTKYLTKQKIPFQSRIRRWGMIGGFDGSRVKDCKYDSQWHRFVKRVIAETGWPKLPFWLVRQIFDSHHVGYREREDFVLWWARERDWKDFEPLNWSEWLFQQELQGIGERDMDGKIPF